MIASEIRQLEDSLEHEKAFVDRQQLLKRLWKLRKEELADDTPLVPVAEKMESIVTGSPPRVDAR